MSFCHDLCERDTGVYKDSIFMRSRGCAEDYLLRDMAFVGPNMVRKDSDTAKIRIFGYGVTQIFHVAAGRCACPVSYESYEGNRDIVIDDALLCRRRGTGGGRGLLPL